MARRQGKPSNKECSKFQELKGKNVMQRGKPNNKFQCLWGKECKSAGQCKKTKKKRQGSERRRRHKLRWRDKTEDDRSRNNFPSVMICYSEFYDGINNAVNFSRTLSARCAWNLGCACSCVHEIMLACPQNCFLSIMPCPAT